MTPRKSTPKPEEEAVKSDQSPITSEQLSATEEQMLVENVSTDSPLHQVATALFPTSFYKSNGIPYCDRCGEKHRTDLYGEPYCPVEDNECPRLK